MVIVIGGGPAGMMAAGAAAEKGGKAILLEKNDRLGRKLSITGKGRCNLTNAAGIDGLLSNTPGNPKFLRAAFNAFPSGRAMDFFERLGVKLAVERGGRVFPESGRAADVVSAMEKYLHINNVAVELGAVVTGIDFGDKIRVKTKTRSYEASKLILASGGMSYPSTGSTGDGYKFAQKAGHTLVSPSPSLVPMRSPEPWLAEVQGLSLKNAGVSLKCGGREAYNGFGEMLFTHFGVSGPLILSASRFFSPSKEHELCVDLKPALGERVLDERILRDFQAYKNKDFGNALGDLLPRAIIPVIVRLSGISPGKKVNSITKPERASLLRQIKCLKLPISGLLGFENAVVTRGGVNVREVSPSTMESKVARGLFFAGEILDVDALTGGYNLQIAFSTGFLAGSSCIGGVG